VIGYRIILAVVANTIIGALWYSPLLFANVWISPTFFESRNLTLYAISAGYHIVALTIMGIILAAFAQ